MIPFLIYLISIIIILILGIISVIIKNKKKDFVDQELLELTNDFLDFEESRCIKLTMSNPNESIYFPQPPIAVFSPTLNKENKN